MAASQLPLDGMRVLDVGTLTPGKYASFLLAELGADVIRVERPQTDVPPSFPSDEDRLLNRNKRSIALDLTSGGGKAVLAELCRRTDILLEANRPGVAARLGFGYEDVRALQANMVYCSLSAFGQSGPYRERPAYDLMLMGLSGVWQAMLGSQPPPPVPGVYLADAVSGLTAAFAIVTACLKRERTGEGTHIDLAMMEATAALLVPSHGLAQRMGGDANDRVGPFRPGAISAAYRAYQAGDGQPLIISAIRRPAWQALCELVGHPEFAELEPGNEAVVDRLTDAIARALASAPASVWLERLQAAGVDCAPLNGPEALHDELERAGSDMVTGESGPKAGSTRCLDSPLGRSFPARERTPAPVPGADTQAIMRELGFGD